MLIHGFAGNTESWSEVAPALARRLNRRVVAFDRPVSLSLQKHQLNKSKLWLVRLHHLLQAFGRTERVMPLFPEAPWAVSRLGKDPYR